MRILVALAMFLNLAAPSIAAISYDATSNSAGGTTVTSTTWSHTVGVGTDTVLLACATIRDGTSGDKNNSTATYAAAAMVRQIQANAATSAYSAIFTKVAPATGANNIVVTYTGTVDFGYGAGMSLFGVDGTTPVEATATATNDTDTGPPSDSTVNTNITPLSDNAWIADAQYSPQDTIVPTANSGQTVRHSASLLNGASNDSVEVTTEGPLTPAGLQTVSYVYTFAGGDDRYALSVVVLKPAGAAAATSGSSKTMKMSVRDD